MGATMYASAIQQAIKDKDLNRMKVVLRQAKKLMSEQGDLKKATKKLEEAIKKLSAKKKTKE